MNVPLPPISAAAGSRLAALQDQYADAKANAEQAADRYTANARTRRAIADLAVSCDSGVRVELLDVRAEFPESADPWETPLPEGWAD